MEGVEFVIDDKGNKKAVLIDLERHSRIWEDFCDTLIAKQRENEPRETFDDVKKMILKRSKD